MPRGNQLCVWQCRPVSSISAATKLHPISAQLRCFHLFMPREMTLLLPLHASVPVPALGTLSDTQTTVVC